VPKNRSQGSISSTFAPYSWASGFMPFFCLQCRVQKFLSEILSIWNIAIYNQKWFCEINVKEQKLLCIYLFMKLTPFLVIMMFKVFLMDDLKIPGTIQNRLGVIAVRSKAGVIFYDAHTFNVFTFMRKRQKVCFISKWKKWKKKLLEKFSWVQLIRSIYGSQSNVWKLNVKKWKLCFFKS